jgi:hypothetical protein
MRLLMIAAITSLMLVPALAQGGPANVAQSDPSSASASDPAASDPAASEDQAGNSVTEPESVEQQHPDWYEETNKYKPCTWDTCPSPPPQR